MLLTSRESGTFPMAMTQRLPQPFVMPFQGSFERRLLYMRMTWSKNPSAVVELTVGGGREIAVPALPPVNNFG
jgi:hypothetical protein